MDHYLPGGNCTTYNIFYYVQCQIFKVLLSNKKLLQLQYIFILHYEYLGTHHSWTMNKTCTICYLGSHVSHSWKSSWDPSPPLFCTKQQSDPIATGSYGVCGGPMAGGGRGVGGQVWCGHVALRRRTRYLPWASCARVILRRMLSGTFFTMIWKQDTSLSFLDQHL